MMNLKRKLSTLNFEFLPLRSQHGQALLVVVLVMVVALTVGLSVLSRSITNLRNAADEEHSQRAFSAAEAGIEHFIKNTCGQETCSIAEEKIVLENAKVSAEAKAIAGGEFLLNGGTVINRDTGVDLWLSDYSSDPEKIYLNPWNGENIVIAWGEPEQECGNPALEIAALEIIVIYGPKDSPTSKRYAYDPCGPGATDRASENNFKPPVPADTTIEGKTFEFRTPPGAIDTSGALIARIVPIYKDAVIGVSGGGDALSSQGNIISSTGKSGETIRKISLVQGYPSLPSEFFNYILFQTK